MRSRIWLGPAHACALQKTGELECWGANAAGQLGDRTTQGRALPGLIAVKAKPEVLALGAHHTCALSGGGVTCWGEGARGQLGTGLTTSLSAASMPVLAAGAPLAGATAIAAGGDRTCALTRDGARCWGDGVAEAKELDGVHGAASLVAVGEGHVCAALVEPRAVRCSGADDRGQSASRAPVLAGAAIKGLTAGAHHTCALLEDGAVECWGGNESGQLGDGTTTDSRVPAIVHGLPPAVEVRAGASHTCVRLRTNTVACWGANGSYQLANGTTDASSKPAPVTGLVGVQELALAGDSACARLADGSVRCWGGNAWGQLGDGTTTAHPVPMPVKASAAPAKAR